MTRRCALFSTEALDALIRDIHSDSPHLVDGKAPRHLAESEFSEYLKSADSSNISPEAKQHVAVCQECASRIDEFKIAAQAWEGPNGGERLEKLRKRLRHGKQLEIAFAVGSNGGSSQLVANTTERVAAAQFITREQMVRNHLQAAGAVESECDYVLPNGLHTSCHVNLGRICRSEVALTPIVGALDGMLKNENFDAIVSTSWAVATLARRVILRRLNRNSRPIQHVTVEGYDPPCILEEVLPGAHVIVLVDVVVTGSQIAKVTAELKKQKAASVKAIAIVDSGFSGKRVAEPSGALCRIAINAAPPGQCPNCESLPRAEFNPVAGRMTKKKNEPRSPSEFLAQDSVAREFWDFVNTTGAFEHHRIVGKRHYIGFIDIARLLQHRLTGETIVKKLCQKICERSGVPDTVLVPTRRKALLLGKRLVEGFRQYLGKGGVRLVTVRQHGGHFIRKGAPDLTGQRVLVVDAATGHGDTLDELALLSSSGAASIAGAVLLSRLSEACEEAYDQRLTAGFTKLYSMPVRPLTVRDRTGVTCPVCLRRQDLRKAIGELPPGTVKEVAKKLVAAAPRFRRRTETTPGNERQAPQLPLYNQSPLATYRPSVASGIALHALHAAMGDGMAPLSLPEIAAHDISAPRRAALVADLPAGVLRWSGPSLEHELCEFLKRGTDREVWVAVVELMSRSGSTAWTGSLEEAVLNAQARGKWMDERFWARMILIVHRMVRNTPETSAELRLPLEKLFATCYNELPARRGLKGMIDSTYQGSNTNCTR